MFGLTNVLIMRSVSIYKNLLFLSNVKENTTIVSCGQKLAIFA